MQIDPNHLWTPHYFLVTVTVRPWNVITVGDDWCVWHNEVKSLMCMWLMQACAVHFGDMCQVVGQHNTETYLVCIFCKFVSALKVLDITRIHANWYKCELCHSCLYQCLTWCYVITICTGRYSLFEHSSYT